MKNALKSALCIVAGLLVLLAVPAFAQDGREYKVQFDHQVALPGIVLQPGTYLFSRPSINNPNLFQVMKPDGTSVGFVEALPIHRTDSGKTEVDLSAPDSTGLRTVQAWYPGGHSQGFAFDYNHKEMRSLDRLARNETVSSSAAGEP